MADTISSTTDLTYPGITVPPNPLAAKATYDIPLVQPLTFYVDKQEAYYLNRETTTDESEHVDPQVLYNRNTTMRVLQPAFVRQGEANAYTFHIKFIDVNGKYDMSNKIIRFAGRNAKGNLIMDDQGFDPTQANLGEYTWSPSPYVSYVPGDFLTSQFIIESPDHKHVYMTVEFTMKVIPNDVSYPPEFESWMSEYARGLYHMKEMQDADDKALAYLNNFYKIVINDRLEQNVKTIKQSEDDADAMVKSVKESMDGAQKVITDFEDGVNKDYQTLNNNFTALNTKINQAGLMTVAELPANIASLIASGAIDVTDKILNVDVKAKIDKMRGLINGASN